VTASVVDKAAGRRSRWPLWAMVAIFALPVVAAWFFFFNPELLPDARANRGELIQPVRPWPTDLPLMHVDGGRFDAATLLDHWTLLTVSPSRCDEVCRARLIELRQIRLALGESSLVVERMAVWVGERGHGAGDASAELAGVREAVVPTAGVPALVSLLGPHQDIWNRIYIVDPFGNLMMRYAADAPPKDVLKDMERLLKASKNWIKGAQYGHR
jgi:cytochrome oxidase Cu insertion factor (SCO1/SenC/PrrC family)